MKPEEMKAELIEALADMRDEYLSVLFHGCRLKDRYGNLWDIRAVVFEEKRTEFYLWSGGNRARVAISEDKTENGLRDYELIKKEDG